VERLRTCHPLGASVSKGDFVSLRSRMHRPPKGGAS